MAVRRYTEGHILLTFLFVILLPLLLRPLRLLGGVVFSPPANELHRTSKKNLSLSLPPLLSSIKSSIKEERVEGVGRARLSRPMVEGTKRSRSESRSESRWNLSGDRRTYTQVHETERRLVTRGTAPRFVHLGRKYSTLAVERPHGYHGEAISGHPFSRWGTRSEEKRRGDPGIKREPSTTTTTTTRRTMGAGDTEGRENYDNLRTQCPLPLSPRGDQPWISF